MEKLFEVLSGKIDDVLEELLFAAIERDDRAAIKRLKAKQKKWRAERDRRMGRT